jgi:hypothetical protein
MLQGVSSSHAHPPSIAPQVTSILDPFLARISPPSKSSVRRASAPQSVPCSPKHALLLSSRAYSTSPPRPPSPYRRLFPVASLFRCRSLPQASRARGRDRRHNWFPRRLRCRAPFSFRGRSIRGRGRAPDLGQRWVDVGGRYACLAGETSPHTGVPLSCLGT